MGKSPKTQEVQIREHQIWDVQTLLDKIKKKASPRVEGSFQWNEPLKILEHSRICEKITAFFMALPQFPANFWEDSSIL